MKFLITILITASTLLFSCKKNNELTFNAQVKGNLTIEFDNIVGSSNLQLNTGSYVNASGETFTVTKLMYYVSNFILIHKDGSMYTVPQDSCYFLIDEANGTSQKPVLRVPEGEYAGIRFTVGVDSLRNTKDISLRTGVLDPTAAAAGMYWSWNSGYIFYKLEGTSTAITNATKAFQYHIGGYGGYQTVGVNNIQTIQIDLKERGMPQIKANKETNIHLMVDVLKALSGKNKISLALSPMVHSAGSGTAIAQNFTAMLHHDHTEN